MEVRILSDANFIVVKVDITWHSECQVGGSNPPDEGSYMVSMSRVVEGTGLWLQQRETKHRGFNSRCSPIGPIRQRLDFLPYKKETGVRVPVGPHARLVQLEARRVASAEIRIRVPNLAPFAVEVFLWIHVSLPN